MGLKIHKDLTLDTTSNVHFLTAALGHKKYIKAATRLELNLSKMGLASRLSIFDVSKLYKIYPHYESLFVKNHNVGYGAWIWKPLIIQSELSRLNENAVLVYLDVGCEVSSSSAATIKLIEYINLSKEKGIVVFDNGQLEKKYTNSEVYRFFDYDPTNADHDIQISASVLVIFNTIVSRSIIDEWASACLFDNGRLAFNKAEISPHVEHRNDQSILSVLLKKTKRGLILPNDTYFPTGEYLMKSDPYSYPFHTTRNYTEFSFLEMYNFFNKKLRFMPFRLKLFLVRLFTFMMVHISLLRLKL